MKRLRTEPPRSGRLRLGLAALLVVACASACDAEDEEASYPIQSKISPLKENPGHHIVTLTPLGARQAGVQTTAVTGSKLLRELPYEALLYGADGTTFVYPVEGKLTFRYMEITLEKVVGKTIYFSEGPEVGTEVATQGVPQIHGADIELEFGDIA